MPASTARLAFLEPATRNFYCGAVRRLQEVQVPFLVGGAYAMEWYTGVERHTKDLDVFVRPGDCGHVLEVLAAAGCETELTYPHWLGKARDGDDFIDVIFSSGNGVATVDDGWFDNAVDAEILDLPVLLCPAEEIIWSKSYVLERERYDGADIAHLLRACGPNLNWQRLLGRFGPDWRVLFSHLILFGYIYPSDRVRVPDWVLHELLAWLHSELSNVPPLTRVCQGTRLSREQYLIDIGRWGYQDARLPPWGTMSPAEVAKWTSAIGKPE